MHQMITLSAIIPLSGGEKVSEDSHPLEVFSYTSSLAPGERSVSPPLRTLIVVMNNLLGQDSPIFESPTPAQVSGVLCKPSHSGFASMADSVDVVLLTTPGQIKRANKLPVDKRGKAVAPAFIIKGMVHASTHAQYDACIVRTGEGSTTWLVG